MKARKHTGMGTRCERTSPPVIGPIEVGKQLEDILVASAFSTLPKKKDRHHLEATVRGPLVFSIPVKDLWKNFTRALRKII